MHFRRLIVLGLLALVGSGCAQVIAYRHPAPLDRAIVTTGVDKTHLVGVLGPPIGSEMNDDGTMQEMYKYSDGGTKNAWGSKAARILLYTAGDVFTLCLDQVIWMPLELAFKATDYTCDITYEKVDRRWIAREIREIEADSQKVTKEMVDTRRRKSAGIKQATRPEISGSEQSEANGDPSRRSQIDAKDSPD